MMGTSGVVYGECVFECRSGCTCILGGAHTPHTYTVHPPYTHLHHSYIHYTPPTHTYIPPHTPNREHPLNEAERFEAVKEKKHSLEAAVALFNRKPLKGITQAITAGLVGEDAAAIAVFLKQHAGLLNKEMLGEYFGHHEQQQVCWGGVLWRRGDVGVGCCGGGVLWGWGVVGMGCCGDGVCKNKGAPVLFHVCFSQAFLSYTLTTTTHSHHPLPPPPVFSPPPRKQIDVMHAYIDLDRYNGLTIDAALRQLLSHFRLPGESQKIDRIMEKFAERYCKDNPTVRVVYCTCVIIGLCWMCVQSLDCV